jgi:DNA helicase-2/ATP-dependent DNA helicase PcrA
MAILFRSVKNNVEPVTAALTRAGVPFIVVGMYNLFGTAEAEAARQLFYFMAARPEMDDAALEGIWQATNLGLDPATLHQAIAKARGLREEFRAANLRNPRFALQRVFLNFLEQAGVREERIPAVPTGRAEVVFYNLGKFSQVISDFQQIHYHSKPVDMYDAFAKFLQFRAEDAYPEGWQDNAYANPDAVRVMTVHQAKGMQWPVVFVPALLKNRFPSKKQSGRSVWHLVPKAGVKDPERYVGSIEDERRLFYVAMTRSQKFLHLTNAPVPGNPLFQTRSVFLDDILASKHVKRRMQDYSARPRLAPTPRAGVANVVFSFSDLKYLFECPYQFKLRILYGFNAPIHEQLGFGRSLHNALADVHARALRRDPISQEDAEALVATHLHLPFAHPQMREDLARAAKSIVANYITDNQNIFDKIEFSEKQVEINLGDGIRIIGRIDLVHRIDTGETTIVDLKSNDRAQPEDVTETQLHVYALGYQELTGRRADYVQIYELDDRRPKTRSVDDDFIADVRTHVRASAEMLRHSNLPSRPDRSRCSRCDHRRLCTPGAQACAN